MSRLSRRSEFEDLFEFGFEEDDILLDEQDTHSLVQELKRSTSFPSV